MTETISDRRREAIARIIDPYVFEAGTEFGRRILTRQDIYRKEQAHAKADKIIAILSSDLGEGMGIRSDSIQKADIDADR